MQRLRVYQSLWAMERRRPDGAEWPLATKLDMIHKAGFMATDKAWVERARAMGYTMIAGGTDNGLLQHAFTQMVGQIEGRTE